MAKTKRVSKKTYKPIWLFIAILLLLSTFVLVYAQQKRSFELKQAEAATYLYDWRTTCNGTLKTYYIANYKMSVECTKIKSPNALSWTRICGGLAYVKKYDGNSQDLDVICLKKR